MSAANRGRYAEGKVRTFLEDWKQKHAAFTYNRILDARSAMGAMANPQPGDFQWFMKTDFIVESVLVDKAHPYFTRNGLIEVKEVYHDFRLPHKNFSPDQVGRMKIRQMAGSEPLVLVCHRVEGTRGGLWRNVPLEFFTVREGGSWDLRQFDQYTEAGDILEGYLS